MSIADVLPAFAKLNLPSMGEYQKRKVALISGNMLIALPLTRTGIN